MRNRRELEARQSTQDLFKEVNSKGKCCENQEKKKSASTSTCERAKSVSDTEKLKAPIVIRCEFTYYIP